jgi:hypothetical protein
MGKVGHGPRIKCALGLDKKLVLLQHGEHEVVMSEVFRPRGDVNKDIVEEDQHKSTQEQVEDIIYQRLEHHWRIGQAEGHDQKLEQSLVRAERGLGNVLLMHPHMVVPQTEVQFGEGGATELIKQLLHHGDGELVLNHRHIECPIVHAEAPGPVTLLH